MKANFLCALVWLIATASAAQAQTTAFTYQGKLTDAGNPANGNYDLQFKLFDTVTVGTGTQQGATVIVSNVAVAAGVFTVQLDFGAGVFSGAPRFLEIAVKPISGGTFTVLGPRQPITSTPYAIKSANAAAADNLSPACVGCVTGAQIGSLPANSGSYIQNTTTPQVGSNFNISGNGTAGGALSGNIVNTATQYNLGGSRILSSGGTNNLFAGLGAGQANTVGSNNAFFGFNAGAANTGDLNDLNLGNENAFFGAAAGEANKAGRNSFFGSKAGQANTTGAGNAFFGYHVGILNNGSNNSFFGFFAGRNNTSGAQNSFFGEQAGDANQNGNYNSYFGETAGFSNISGSYNTMIGRFADVGSGNLTNATAIGANTRVDQSNALVLGSVAGVSGATTSVNVGIGTTTPASRLDIAAAGNGAELLRFSTERPWVFRQVRTGSVAGLQLLSTSGIKQFEITALGGTNVATFIADDANPRVGLGTTTPTERLSVNGNLTVFGFIQLGGPGFGGEAPLCRHATTQQIAFCASSLRYKKDLAPFIGGLAILNRLRPITFTWKSSGTRDLGLGAEEVAQVEPLLVTRNDQGEIEGVKYAQLNVVLINAVKEQQTQLETQAQQIAVQQTQLKHQQQQLDALKKLVCQANPQAAACQE